MSYNTLYDVIVCGGGTSGVAAAIAAARGGAKTLLVERTGTLGGQMSVSGPPGFAYARLFNPRGERDVGGIVEETFQRLYGSGHALPHLRFPVREKAGYGFSYVDPDWWTMLVFEMMDEEGIELLLDTLVVGVTRDGDTVNGIVAENANGRNGIKGKMVIDCTGEAYVAMQAGCETACVSREEVQPHTLSFTVDGVDWNVLLQYIRNHPEQFSFKQLIFPHEGANTREDVMDMYRKCHDITDLGEIMGFYELRDMALKNGDWHPYSGAGFFLIPREGGHIQAHFQHSSQADHALPTDAWDITQCIIECRRQNMIAWRFFKNYVPGFKNAYITRVCTELRLREGPRIVGDYVLTREDVADAKQFPDTIGRSSFKAGSYHVASMDTLNVVAATDTTESPAPNVNARSDIAYPKDGGSYDIPYRCLVPKKIENLLAAGKCVSTDRPAYLRYLHQTMVTGQAAGAAAALCVKKGVTPRSLEKDVKELQDILLRQGAVLYGGKTN
jgi:Dehydrogenases (flavoproteins)